MHRQPPSEMLLSPAVSLARPTAWAPAGSTPDAVEAGSVSRQPSTRALRRCFRLCLAAAAACGAAGHSSGVDRASRAAGLPDCRPRSRRQSSAARPSLRALRHPPLRGGAGPASSWKEEDLRSLFEQVLAQTGGAAPEMEAGGAAARVGVGWDTPQLASAAMADGRETSAPALDWEGLLVFLSRTETACRFHLTERQVRVVAWRCG